MTSSVCDVTRLGVGDLQRDYGGFGIEWVSFLQILLGSRHVYDVTLCRVRLSPGLQYVLQSQTATSMRQFIIIHSLLHSDLFLLLTSEYTNRLENVRDFEFKMASETREEKCLDLLLHFLPSLEKYTGCDESNLYKTHRVSMETLRHIKESLFRLLSTSLRVHRDVAARVANASVEPVMADVGEELLARCRAPRSPQGEFSHDNFDKNMVELIKFHNSEYFQGRQLPESSSQAEMSAFWVSASLQGRRQAVAGPVVYPGLLPQPVMYGSLGTFLATRVSHTLGIRGWWLVTWRFTLFWS